MESDVDRKVQEESDLDRYQKNHNPVDADA